MGMPAEKFGRMHHLPAAAQLAAVVDWMRDRGLIGDDGWLSGPGRAVMERVAAHPDDLAAKPYECLAPDELEATLEPLAALLLAAQDWSTQSPRLRRGSRIVVLGRRSAPSGSTAAVAGAPRRRGGSDPRRSGRPSMGGTIAADTVLHPVPCWIVPSSASAPSGGRCSGPWWRI
jgi:hypothetical protein